MQPPHPKHDAESFFIQKATPLKKYLLPPPNLFPLLPSSLFPPSPIISRWSSAVSFSLNEVKEDRGAGGAGDNVVLQPLTTGSPGRWDETTAFSPSPARGKGGGSGGGGTFRSGSNSSSDGEDGGAGAVGDPSAGKLTFMQAYLNLVRKRLKPTELSHTQHPHVERIRVCARVATRKRHRAGCPAPVDGGAAHLDTALSRWPPAMFSVDADTLTCRAQRQ